MGSSVRYIGNWPLQLKLGLGFGTVALLMLLNSIGFFIAQAHEQDARGWTAHTYEVLNELQNLQIAALSQQTSLRGYVLTSDEQVIKGYDTGRKDFEQTLLRLQALTQDNPAQEARLGRANDAITRWHNEASEPLRALVTETGTQYGTAPLIAKGRPAFAALLAVIEETRQAEMLLLNERSDRLAATVANTRTVTLLLLIVGLVFTVVAIRLTQEMVTRPVIEMTELMTRLVAKDQTIEVPRLDRGDEIGAIARSLEAFKHLAIETSELNWIKTGVNDISSRLQPLASRRAFANELAASVAQLLGCGYAIVYQCVGDNDAEAIGGFGYRFPLGSNLFFRGGEGLVGEAMLRGEPIRREGLPEHYAQIQSGAGSAKPSQLLILPMTVKGFSIGVMELASLKPFTVRDHRLLDELMPIAALSFDNVRRGRRTEQLLVETQAQAEELRTSQEALRIQQEELGTTNDSLHAKTALLEEQAARLKASEEELKEQAEQLRVSNEELTDKSSTLARQKVTLESLQRETQDKADELAQASQYKSEFLANMSHELRTPLNSLLILSKYLAQNESQHLDSDEVESAAVIHDSGTKLLQLINDILDLSKVEAGKMEVLATEISLAGVVTSMQRNFRHVATERGLQFEVEVADGLPETIETDGTRLEQILNNLLGNAFKFTRKGGVRLRFGRPDVDQAMPLGALRDQFVAISVTDTGIGIPADKAGRLFQAFEQADAGTSRQFGGTGLGLSIARGMARLLGGDIAMKSEFGVGSTFTMLLPERLICALPAPRENAGDQTGDARDERPSRTAPLPLTVPRSVAAVSDDRDVIVDGETVILVIEDDESFLRILVDLIRRKGCRVLAAGDGEAGLALARQFQPSGVLLDVTLPGMDGWTVIDLMKADAKLKTIPVHFISANEDAERGIEAGAIGFLTKPVTRAGVLQAFDKLLHPVQEKPRRVLLVDDDADSRMATHMLLADTGVELVDAGSAEEAMELLAETRFDCIVLDLGLPGMSGGDFLEHASATGPLPPVVIHSGRELSRDESLKLRQYTDSIVIKGARSPERLLDEVSLFLHTIRKAVPLPHEADTGLNGRTVLVVDDDMRNIFALSKTLRAKGLKVLMAQDGHKGLKQLQENPTIDIVLMDIMMPGMDGYETIRQIRGTLAMPSMPIIALTAKAMLGDREKCLEAGANDYLSKPIDIDKLVSMMRVWVNS